MSGGPPRVLVVDDQHLMVEHVLKAEGAEITVAASVAEVEAQIAAGEHWDLALVDFVLGELPWLYERRSDPPPGGLSAIAALTRGPNPRAARVLGFSELTGGTSALLSLLASSWYGCPSVRKGASIAVEDLLDRKRDPREPQLQMLHARSARHVSLLFAEAKFVDVWRAHLTSTHQKDLLPTIGDYYLRDFYHTVGPAIASLQVLGRPVLTDEEWDQWQDETGRRSHFGPVRLFAVQHDYLFSDPGLPELLDELEDRGTLPGRRSPDPRRKPRRQSRRRP